MTLAQLCKIPEHSPYAYRFRPQGGIVGCKVGVSSSLNIAGDRTVVARTTEIW